MWLEPTRRERRYRRRRQRRNAGVGLGGGISVPPVGGSPSSSICGSQGAPAPLTRYSIVDIDGTLDALFGPGTTLASVVTTGDTGYYRDLSPSFVQALRRGSDRARRRRGEGFRHVFDLREGTSLSTVVPQAWLGSWGAKLYRRPLTGEQVEAYVAQFVSVTATRTPAEAARNALVSMILSPYFVMRIELGDGAPNAQLTPYELAARLSHFATRRSPDAELTASAASGALSDPMETLAQLHRLSSTPEGKSARELQHLEWLDLAIPSDRADLDPELRNDMLAQTRAFITDVFEHQDASLTSLLSSPRLPLDARLAAQYGVPRLRWS